MTYEQQKKKKLAVWKFTSCDGCQLSLLDCEDELLAIASRLEIAHFLEASSEVLPGPYDLSVVEGSITTPEEKQRIQEIRKQSRLLVTIGACATSGGIQALRNFADVVEYTRYVYANKDFIETLATSTGIKDHVKVDFELRGCPINKKQLLEVILAFLAGRKPNIAEESVCVECKRLGNVCIMVARSLPCMGPITQAGCDALCPSYDRGCFGCYGPKEHANVDSMIAFWTEQGIDAKTIERMLKTYNAWAEPLRSASKNHKRSS